LPRESTTDAIGENTAPPLQPTTTTVSPAATPSAGTVRTSLFEKSSVTDSRSTVWTNPGAVCDGAAATAAVEAEVADVDPSAPVAVTTTRIVEPTSAAPRRSCVPVPTFAHEPSLHRCHA
jgi:hypothetical protein